MFASTGKRYYGLEADNGFGNLLGSAANEVKSLLALDVDLSGKAGWSYLKSLPIKRCLRKKMLSSRRCVHLFSGERRCQSEEFTVLESEAVVYVGVDLANNRG